MTEKATLDLRSADDMLEDAWLAAREARNQERLDFHVKYGRFVKCVKCGAAFFGLLTHRLDLRCQHELVITGYTAPEEIMYARNGVLLALWGNNSD